LKNDLKKINTRIAEAEHAKKLFIHNSQTDAVSQVNAVAAIIREICRYLNLLYDKKERLLIEYKKADDRKASEKHQKKYANIRSAGKDRRR